MQQFGLGLGEIMKMNTDSALLLEVRRQLEELKKEHADLKHDKRLLEIDLRNAQTDVSKAEAKEALAVMMAKAENKGFFDSDGFQKLLADAPNMLEKIALLKNGNSVEPVGLGNPDLSETQKEFIEYVVENLNDNQIVFIGSIIRHMNNLEFVNTMTELMKNYDAAM